jgi:diguanylate cyclase (GGDEF)-like protein/PAS domain S-box-containing protein
LHKEQLILIVDDNKMNLKVLGNILRKNNYQIAVAKNGKNALLFIKKRKPDLILLDIMMPGIDGYEVCNQLKQDEETKEIPVIFISALQEEKNKLKGFKLGAVDYIIKPFQEKEVLARVNTHLELKQVKEKLIKENRWFKSLFANATEPVILFDQNHCVVDINEEFEKNFKYKLNEIKGMNIDDVMEQSRKNSANKEATKTLMSGKQVELEETRYTKNGRAIECLIKAIPVVIDGQPEGGFVMYVDITELKKKEEKIRYISFHDQMTGLYNRRYFEDEIKRMDKSRRLPISLIVADIDGLKRINDNYGHREGDKYIKKAASIMKSVTRAEDVVARIGGDEFAVILPETGKEDVARIVERIEEKCKNNKNELKVPIAISAGYAVKFDHEQELEEIIKKADKNMYNEKNS